MKAAIKGELLRTLKARFGTHMGRHKGIAWGAVESTLEANPRALDTLSAMERTGGEPDVIGFDDKTGAFHVLRLCGRKSERTTESLL